MTLWFYPIACVALLYLWMMLSITLHEVAHILVGKATGFAPDRMTVGSGRLLFQKKIWGAECLWYARPVGGRAYPGRIPLAGLWWRGALFALAGPASDLLLVFLLCAPIVWPIWTSEGPPEWRTFLGILVAIQFAWLLASVYPHDYRSEGRLLSSDGKFFLSYITGQQTRNTLAVLQTIAERVVRYDPGFQMGNSWLLRANREKWLLFAEAETDLSSHRFDSAVEKYLSLVESPGLSPGEQAMMLDALASIPIFYGVDRYLERALLWAHRACELCPKVPTLAGTLGSLLVESGKYPEGIEMLLPLTTPENTPADRSISSCYLAKAYARLGEHAQADHWILLAREIGGFPEVLQKIEARLSPQSQPETS